MQLQNLLDDLVDRARDHALVQRIIERDSLIGKGFIALEHAERAALGELHVKVMEMLPVWAVRIGAPVGFRRLVIVSHENGSHDSPRVPVGRPTRFCATRRIHLPMLMQPRCGNSVGRHERPAAAAEAGDALGTGIARGRKDRGMRLLIGLDHVANAELGPSALLSDDIPVLTFDPERRLTFP
jgi:hypothetical protein